MASTQPLGRASEEPACDIESHVHETTDAFGNPQMVKLTTTADNIFDAIDLHRCYQKPGSTKGPDTPKSIEWLPLLDIMDLYDIDEKKRESMSRIEANRLHKALKGFKRLRFEMDEPLGDADLHGYSKLDAAGWKLLWCFIICDHDIEIALFEKFPQLFDESRLAGIQEALESRLDRDSSKILENNLELCWALVDYLTAIVGLMVIDESDNAEWQARCLADLARWSMKVKVLCQNPKEYTERSLGSARDMMLMEKVKRKGLLMGVHVVKGFGVTRRDLASSVVQNAVNQQQARFNLMPDFDSTHQFDTDDDRLEAAYMVELVGTRRTLNRVIRLIISLFVSSEKSGMSSQSFEVSLLATELGLHTTTVLFGQDRDGELNMSASGRVAWGAQKMSSRLVEITQTVLRTAGWVVSQGGTVTVSCESETVGNIEPFDTASLDAVVTLLVPLGCAQPYSVSSIADLARIFNLVSMKSDFLRPVAPVKFSALFVMRTKSFENELRDMAHNGNVAPGMDPEADHAVPDTQAVSTSLMSRNGLEYLHIYEADRKFDSEIQQGKRGPKWNSKEELQEEIQEMRSLHKEITRHWTIDETSITISYASYVLRVAFACVVLVLGGIAVGFTVQERIKGVDPFNITVFCWALAAFILVVAKAYRVQDWPWRDYLRRRVVCRSLSELCDVTHKDAQQVLQYLLWNEPSTTLITRGPYNKLFYRKDQSGFSIDQKIELRTMFAAGVVVVKVVSPQGIALVCRRITEGDTLRGFMQVNPMDEDDKDWVCIESSASSSPGQDATLVEMSLEWNRILGIYNVPRREFR
ncbi:hypothetical protein F5882DRAFT_483746 [Hyaloscypha sp. PMI_1271]|nr:hypothetical protein F5882DRAFT_483746 [Hyaloscypha sp. PMI_1271]